MPGGLRDVTQKFDADSSGYIEGLRRMIDQNRQLIESVRDVVKQTEEIRRVTTDDSGWRRMAASLDETSRTIREYRGIIAEANAANKAFNESQIQTEKLSREGRDALRGLSDEYRRHGETVAQAKQAQAIFRDGLIDQANSSRDAVVAMSDHEQAVARLAKTYGTAQEAFAKSDFSAPLKATAGDVKVLQQTLRDTFTGPDGAVHFIGDINKSLEDAKANTAAWISGMTTAASAIRTARATTATANLAADLVDASGRGGGGAGTAALLGALAGGAGAGGGIGGLMRAASGGGGPDPGTAAAQFATVAAFTKRWYPVAHWAMMLSNELLATVGPATAAAGMGGLVGMQGGEQAIPRLRAIFNTAESLGGSLNTTAGQFMGLKTPQLQNAQDLATGAAFEGIGALTNIMRAGGGSPFIQLGSNTDAMWSRMMANITMEFQKGLGKQLGGLVADGTDYLAEFGHVLGNLGHTFLNVAPNLPGVGGDLLGTLQGATGLLSSATGWLGPALGPILGFEAGARWGPPIVGGAGRLLSLAGKPLITAGTALSGAGVEAGLSTRLGALGLTAGEGIAGAGTGLATAGAVLGSLTAPEIGAIAGTVFMLGKGLTYQTPGQQWAGGLVSQVNQAGIEQSMPMAIAAMQKLSRVKGPDYPTSGLGGAFYQDLNNLFTTGRGLAKGHPGALVTGVEAGVKGFWDELFGGKTLPTNVQAANAAINQLSQGLVNAFGTGQQVSDQWKKLGGGAVDMGKAFDIATMAQLQLGKSFEQNGKLTAQAKTMIANLYAGYQPMNMNTGQFGAAVGAQTAMSGLQHTQVAAVNTAYDQLTQLVAGGPSGAAAFGHLLGQMPKGSGGAMRGFLSPQAQAAWTAFASTTNPSVISQLQQQTDYLREAQTMGALGAGQTAGMAEFLLGRALPSAKGSPAALAMLSMIGQQFGGPAFAPGTSAGQMYRQLSAFAGQGGGVAGFNRGMTLSTENMANIGRDAQQFVQQIGSGIGGALAQGIATHGAQLQDAFMNVAGHKGTAQALGKYTQFLQASGVPLKGAQDMISYAAKLSGATPAQINAMMAQVKQHYQITIDAQDRATTKALQAKNAINAVIGKHVHIDASTNAPAVAASAKAAMASVPNVTRTITVVENMILNTPGFASRGAAQQAAGAAGKMIAIQRQTGGMVPGSGSGDIIPAMLEPGEAIVPRNLVSLVAPILAAHRVPGFGGMPQSSASHFAGGGIVPWPHTGFPVSGNIGKDIGYTLVDGITAALKQSGAQKIAQALVNKISQEVQYAKQVASGVRSGLNLAGMDLTQGSVLQQMQGYAASSAAFGKDLTALRRGHLNKDLISQIVAAGPVQGDLLAQSILGTGIKGVNQVYGQIVGSSKIIGAQAAMAQFGGMVAPNLRSATAVSNHVSITVNAKGGGGLAGMSAADIKRLVEEIQAALLKQARRNQKTGLQLSGKGA